MDERLINFTLSKSSKVLLNTSKIGLSKVERLADKQKELERAQLHVKRAACIKARKLLLNQQFKVEDFIDDLSLLKSWSKQAAILNQRLIEPYVPVTFFSSLPNLGTNEDGFAFSTINKGRLASFALFWKTTDAESSCSLELINGFKLNFKEEDIIPLLKKHMKRKAFFLDFIVNVVWPMFE